MNPGDLNFAKGRDKSTGVMEKKPEDIRAIMAEIVTFMADSTSSTDTDRINEIRSRLVDSLFPHALIQSLREKGIIEVEKPSSMVSAKVMEIFLPLKLPSGGREFLVRYEQSGQGFIQVWKTSSGVRDLLLPLDVEESLPETVPEVTARIQEIIASLK